MTRNVCIYLLQQTLQQQSSSMNKTRMKPQLAAITEVGNQNVSHEFYHFKEVHIILEYICKILTRGDCRPEMKPSNRISILI